MFEHIDMFEHMIGERRVGSTVFESAVFSDMFGTAEMRAVFAHEALIGRYLEVEVALARTQARSRGVPQPAADEIDGAPAAVRSHCDPMNCVGLAPPMVDSVLARPNRN